jgi:Family of unknown function (DUF6188)
MGPQLIEEPDRWVLPLDGRTVTRCLIDYSFGLSLDGEPSVEVSLSHFRFWDRDDQEYSLNAEADRRLLAPVLACFGLTVAHAYAWKSGQLELVFTDGSRIEGDSHSEFEAWQVSGPGNVLVVSPAGGGEPAVWDGSPGIIVRPDDEELRKEIEKRVGRTFPH